MKTLADHVALAPIIFDHQKGANTSTVKGFSGSDKTMRTLVKGVVVFDSPKFQKGQVLYFRAEIAAVPQLKQVLIYKSAEGIETEFILLPEGMAVGAE